MMVPMPHLGCAVCCARDPVERREARTLAERLAAVAVLRLRRSAPEPADCAACADCTACADCEGADDAWTDARQMDACEAADDLRGRLLTAARRLRLPSSEHADGWEKHVARAADAREMLRQADALLRPDVRRRAWADALLLLRAGRVRVRVRGPR